MYAPDDNVDLTSKQRFFYEEYETFRLSFFVLPGYSVYGTKFDVSLSRDGMGEFLPSVDEKSSFNAKAIIFGFSVFLVFGLILLFWLCY